MPKDLNLFFSPKSIVVIGASRSPEKVGAVVLKNLIDSGYEGSLYAVNPHAEEIFGVKCYKNVADLPIICDLAIISLPAALVFSTVGQIKQKGIKNAVILSAGFKEIGAEGAALEKQLTEFCINNDVTILGPNCLGFVNNTDSINTTFAKVSKQKGSLRFISQSGALATSLFDYFSSVGLGFSEFITLGNKSIINENDVLEYFLKKNEGPIDSLANAHEQEIEPLGMYLESISNGQKFLQLTKNISKNNPVFIIKPGKTQASVSAMQSHTGSIAGADDILETALKQSGVYRCKNLEEFFDLSKAYAWSPVPQGPRVAIISNAGGPAVITTDAVVTSGLEMAVFDEDTTKKLAEVLPRSASIIDPVDVLGDALADRFANAVEIVLKTDKCDSLLVILTPQMMTQVEKTAEMIGEISRKYHKPIFCSFIGGTMIQEGEKVLNKLKIPSFMFPERAIAVISAMWQFKKSQQKLLQSLTDINVLNSQILPDKCNEILSNAINNKQRALDNLQADNFVSFNGIQTPPSILAESLADAHKFSEDNGYPVVLKLSSPGLLHKKHLGGVILNIRNQEQLENAWNSLERKLENFDAPQKDLIKFQVQKEIPSDVEVLVGIRRDPTFGPVLLFGAGGSLAELILDKNLHLLPLDINNITDLVKQSKIYNLLKGGDNEPARALDKLYKLIFDLCKVFESSPQISEMEINPVIVSINDVYAVDTKIILETSKPKPTGPKFKFATTTKADLLAGKVRYFEFEADQPLTLQPGQYLSVKVSPTRINCYSVAGQSSPTKFYLLVDSTPGGPGSKYFEALKVGDKMTFLGPLGRFTFNPNDNAETLIFLATGTGLAPLKSMIEDILERLKSKQNIALYLGINNYTDIFMQSYFENLSKKYPNFKYQITVANPHENWKGPTGFITSLLKNDFPDASKCAAYLCGNKFMIKDATQILTDNGCPPERIYFEKYDN